MKKYTIGEFAKEIGVTVQTLRNWDKSDKMKPHHIAPSGHRHYSEQQRCDYLGIEIRPEDDSDLLSSEEVGQKITEDFIQVALIFARRMPERESNIVLKMIQDLSVDKEE